MWCIWFSMGRVGLGDDRGLTLDLKNTTKFAGSRGISPDAVNGLALAASKGGRWV